MRTPLTAALAATALLTLVQPAFAQTPAADAPGTVVRAGDDALTCTQMADEAATISAAMGEQGPGLLGRVTGVARAGASMLVPGAGLALAGADALTSSGREKKEAAVDARRDRWNYLNGLYAGRGCGENAAQTAAAQPAQTSAQAAAAMAPAATPATTPAPVIVPAPVTAPMIVPAYTPVIGPSAPH
jgi:hypothetical protein